MAFCLYVRRKYRMQKKEWTYPLFCEIIVCQMCDFRQQTVHVQNVLNHIPMHR